MRVRDNSGSCVWFQGLFLLSFVLVFLLLPELLVEKEEDCYNPSEVEEEDEQGCSVPSLCKGQELRILRLQIMVAEIIFEGNIKKGTATERGWDDVVPPLISSFLE